ncbi:MAG TPA: hypothetical protein VJO53_14475 [Candidatus Acidoferrales bacterium]|nr:hypothetical protein [Candidatus Acidoferrales bacterium]
MVLAIAALLFQFAPGTQALPDVALAPLAPAAKSAANTSTSTKTASAAAQSNGSAPTTPVSATLTATAFDSASQNSQVLSTVRIPEAQPAKPIQIIPVERPSRRTWLILSIAQHGAATFDAYSTRRALATGATEGDPMMHPFAHSPGIYAAIQVGPVVMDYAARRMQRSENSVLRHTWWLPQSVSTGVFLLSGIHNMNVANRR